jgi:hypothetical protein
MLNGVKINCTTSIRNEQHYDRGRHTLDRWRLLLFPLCGKQPGGYEKDDFDEVRRCVMKIKFLTVLLAIVLIASFGCSKEPHDDTVYTVGYIVDYERCAGFKERGETTACANAYFIISENLQDTILTYNLPDDLFEFPSAFFVHAGPDYSWDDNPGHPYRYAYKIRFTYRLAEEEEKIILVCDAFHYKFYPRTKQAIINKVSKL